ncbi:MAG: hypothetical protein U1E61_10910 [Bradyrhizobium sp.]
MAATETTTAAAARPSVVAGVLAAGIVSLVTLGIATFELSMSDFPSALVLMGILPLAALLFFACLVWSAAQLLRIRKDGIKFALPFAICVATLLALQYAPLSQIYLSQNFWHYRTDRLRIVERVENGELTPNVDYNSSLIALPRRDAHVSAGGDIVIEDADEGVYVLFLTSRGLKHYFTGFLRVPPDGDPKKFFEFADKPPTQLVRYDREWWFVAN